MKRIIFTLAIISLIICSCNKEDNTPKNQWTIFNSGDGILNSAAHSVTCDKDGKIYIGQTGGITTYENGNFHLEEFENQIIADIFQDNTGKIWAGVKNNKLMRLENNQWIIPNEDISNIINISQGTNNSIWVCTAGKDFYNFNGSIWEKYRIPNNLTLNDGFVKFSVVDQKGLLWLGGWDGLYSFDGSNWEFYDINPELWSEYMECVLITEKGDVYAAAYYEGLKKYEEGAWIDFLELPHEWVKSLYQSTNGDIWIGFAYEGVARYDGTNLIHYDDENLKEYPISDICQDKDGNMWFVQNYGDIGRVTRFSNWQ